MKNKLSLIGVAAILSVGLLTSITAFAHGGSMQSGPMSDNSTHSAMPMKDGMGMGSMSMGGMGMKDMSGMMSNCKSRMETYGHQTVTTATAKSTGSTTNLPTDTSIQAQ
tara:strand:- start:12609 stop:12935 length:327 start_codon:yes stop_codon:yes gene_type:complete